MVKDWIEARDGIRLYLREWARQPAAGTILIVHGLGEHIGRYEHVAKFVNAHGWRAVGYDHRGHGRSGGGRGVLARGDDLLVDLAQVIDAVRGETTGPLVLLGHSLGGLVAARFVAGGLERPRPAWHREVEALMLSSPVLASNMSFVQKAMLAVLEPLTPNLAVGNAVKSAWLSRDPAVVAAYDADPRVHDRIAPRLARFVVDSGTAVLARAATWTVPTLLLWAGSDRVVDARGSAAFAAAAPPGVVSSRAFAPLFHEIFNEPEQAEVLSALAAWLDKLPVSPTRNSP